MRRPSRQAGAERGSCAGAGPRSPSVETGCSGPVKDRRRLATMAAVRRVFLAGVIALALFAGTAQDARAADPCGLPQRGAATAWVDFADGSVPFWYRFARPGIIAAASNFIYPPKLRSLGAKTVYFDLYMNSRVGTPAKPTTEQETVDWAHRIFYRAVASADCSRPWMALNELFGAHTTTPWTATTRSTGTTSSCSRRPFASSVPDRSSSSRASRTHRATPETGGARRRTMPTSSRRSTSRAA